MISPTGVASVLRKIVCALCMASGVGVVGYIVYAANEPRLSAMAWQGDVWIDAAVASAALVSVYGASRMVAVNSWLILVAGSLMASLAWVGAGVFWFTRCEARIAEYEARNGTTYPYTDTCLVGPSSQPVQIIWMASTALLLVFVFKDAIMKRGAT